MNIPVVGFKQLPKIHKKYMAGIIESKPITVFSYTEALNDYKKKIKQHFQILAMCELVGRPHFALHLGYDIQ